MADSEAAAEVVVDSEAAAAAVAEDSEEDAEAAGAVSEAVEEVSSVHSQEVAVRELNAADFEEISHCSVHKKAFLVLYERKFGKFTYGVNDPRFYAFE